MPVSAPFLPTPRPARPPGPPGHGRYLPARRRAHASGTHTEGLRNGPRAISHISDMSSLIYLFGRCHTPPRSFASCGSLALRPFISLVNAMVRDALPRTGLLFAHKTQRTHPAAKGTVVGAHETAQQCTTRQTHTHTAIPALPTHKARAMLTCTAVHHASGTSPCACAEGSMVRNSESKFKSDSGQHDMIGNACSIEPTPTVFLGPSGADW